MSRLLRWSTALCLLLILAACSRQPKVVTVSEEDSGNQVELREGDTLEVRLESVPGTGFVWEPEAEELVILMEEGNPDFESDSDLVGAPAVMVLHFKAIALGEETLRLVYHKPWEDVDPENSFEVDVVVQ